MPRLANTRFNPAPGVKDFWSEFRKPNPYRVPILLASTAPFGLIFYWLAGETVYKVPDPPQITYITTFDPERTQAEIIASNQANQEVKELREAREAQIAARKRELYKALGAAAGMDVEEIARRADAKRAAEEAAEQARREELFGRSNDEQADESEAAEASASPDAAPTSESPAP